MQVYADTYRRLSALFTNPDSTATSPTTLYAVVEMTRVGGSGFNQPDGTYLMAWDTNTGAFLHLSAISGAIVFPDFDNGVAPNYSTGLWIVDGLRQNWTKYTLSSLQAGTFQYPTITSSTFGLQTFSMCAIDDTLGFLLNAYGAVLTSYKTNGAKVGTLTMSGNVLAMTFQKSGFVYVLCDTGFMVLLNYINMTVVSKVSVQGNFSVQANFLLYYYPVLNIVMVMNVTPDGADGSATTVVSYYGFVNRGVRLTTPLPLAAATQGQNVPVFVQILDDLNQGVSGIAIIPAVTEAGNLIGIPNPDGQGREVFYVACNAAGEVALECTAVSP